MLQGWRCTERGNRSQNNSLFFNKRKCPEQCFKPANPQVNYWFLITVSGLENALNWFYLLSFTFIGILLICRVQSLLLSHLNMP